MGPYRRTAPPSRARILRRAAAASIAIVLAILPLGSIRAEGDVGIHKIKHVIVIMQENRSFDSYFGTYSGANGFPMMNGKPAVCIPDPIAGHCVRPYHTHADVESGGPHGADSAGSDVDGGKMDGFIREAERAGRCRDNDPSCVGISREDRRDVVAYHDRRELSNYWHYADRFVLQDRMFEPNLGWSLPSHLFMVSGWSALCSDPADAMTCTSNLDHPDVDQGSSSTKDRSDGDDVDPPSSPPDFGWTDLTYLLHKRKISWRYYIVSGTQPDCTDGSQTCSPKPQNATTPEIWNPLPDFQTVHADHELSSIQDVGNFYRDAANGKLPAVSWVIPSNEVSEHPPARASSGQAYVTGLINAVMRSPSWNSTAVFLSWDDWGGFYDHVVPPKIDANGLGLRVPGLLISPYAKRGYIDHQVLSFDSYLKFIEDDFLGAGRIDPRTDGRPDRRPTVREASPRLGDLTREFDFEQSPRKPVVRPGGSVVASPSPSPSTTDGPSSSGGPKGSSTASSLAAPTGESAGTGGLALKIFAGLAAAALAWLVGARVLRSRTPPPS